MADDSGPARAAVGPFAFRAAAPTTTATSSAPSGGASGSAAGPDGFHEFLQRRQPVPNGGGSSVVSGERLASTTTTSAGSAGDAATSATSSTGPSSGSATGGRIGLLAPFVPAVRDSPNYSAPPPLVPQRSDQASSASSQQDEGTTTAGAAGASSATPPSQPLPAGAAAAMGNRVLVHPRQKGNVVLKYIRNVPWEYSDDIAPDFMVGQRNCVTFLSLRYHKLHPEYVHTRLRDVGRGYKVRVLLVLIDMRDCDDALRELSRVAIAKGLSLLIASSEKEAGRYIETFKLYENKSADALQGGKPEDYLSRLRGALTTVKSVNKTDTVTLLTTFGSLRGIAQASVDDLRMCPGFGESKAAKLRAVFDQPFDTRGSSKTDAVSTPSKAATKSSGATGD